MNKSLGILGILALAVSCDGTSTDPTPPPAGSNLAVFTDPASGFSTTDVRDVDDQIVRFNPADRTLIWTPSNLIFDNWPVNGNLLGPTGDFQVRFGTVSGQRRAYFTETGRGTICDLQVDSGNVLRLLPTNSLPPNS
jgi:hypothetical protein